MKSRSIRGESAGVHTIPSCSGLMFQNECSTNSAPPFIGVCRTKHLSTWCTATLPSQTSPVGSICDQPAATISCSYHDTDVRCSAVGPSLLLFRWPGTRCQTAYETRHVLRTAFRGISELFYSHLLAVRGLAIVALYKSTIGIVIDDANLLTVNQ